MPTSVPRLRMFAGPNGSGKTTLIRELAREYSAGGIIRLNHYVNADDIERELSEEQGLAVDRFCLNLSLSQLKNEITSLGRITPDQLNTATLELRNARLHVERRVVDSYLAAAIGPTETQRVANI